MLNTIVTILVIVWLLSLIPVGPVHPWCWQTYGPYPGGGMGVIVLVLLILALTGRL